MKAAAVEEKVRGSAFSQDEPVLQSHVIRDPGIPVPLFGDDNVTHWDLNSIGRPANASADWGRINFAPLQGSWLHYAKELTMLLLNPQHPELAKRRIYLENNPLSPRTVKRYVSAIKILHELAHTHGYPANLSWWMSDDFEEAIAVLNGRGKGRDNVRYIVKLATYLHSFRSAFSEDGLAEKPWRQKSRKQSSDAKTLRTDPVSPEIYFPLLQAAWAYVSLFSVDILAAVAEARQPKPTPALRGASKSLRNQVVAQFIDDPTNLVPLKRFPTEGESWEQVINWSVLSDRLTGNSRSQPFLLREPGLSRRKRIIDVAQGGRVEIGGVFTPTVSLPQSNSVWSEGLDKRSFGNEKRMLREACYIIITALTMMRDSEVQEIRRGSITTYFGVSAIKSPILKNEPDRPLVYWWITDPVKRAIEVLEELSDHTDLLFSSSRRSASVSKGMIDAGGFDAGQAIGRFRERVNANAFRTGLSEIPSGAVTPHMLRRTIAMLTEQEHGGQIAAGFQLHHSQRTAISNSLTGQYTAGSEKWARELGVKQAQVDARRAIDDLATRSANANLRGPGAKRLGRSLNLESTTVSDQTKARMLAAEFPNMKYGTTNLCLGDRSVAACLTDEERDNEVPVQPSVCDPTRCGNSVLMPMHVVLWELEGNTLRALRRTRRLSPMNRAVLDARIASVQRALGKRPGGPNVG